jgi:outer membrane biosynthesis protein TonB
MQPNFGRPTSPGDNIRNALNDAAHSRGGDTGSPRPSRHSGPLNLGGVEVLSDTQNVDFNPYLRRILGDIKRNWDPLIPAEAQSPLFKQGESYIRFTILPDGTIKDASMHLDGSTHDEAINRSCWGAITSEGQFPPLPKDFHGPEFVLRIHFLVNRGLPDQ